MWSSLPRRLGSHTLRSTLLSESANIGRIAPAPLSCALSHPAPDLQGRSHPFRHDLRAQGWGSLTSTIAGPRHFSLSVPNFKDKDDDEYKGLTTVQKFKKMAKDYWYVVIPVHGVTSLFWFGSFYLACKSGVDVPAILQSMGASDEYLDKIRGSEWTNYLMAYACYKVATPARYTVTVGGTTWTISYLRERGMLKTTSDLKDKVEDRWEGSKMKERSDNLREKVEDRWENSRLKESTDNIKEKVEDRWDNSGFRKRSEDLKESSENVRKKLDKEWDRLDLGKKSERAKDKLEDTVKKLKKK